MLNHRHASQDYCNYMIAIFIVFKLLDCLNSNNYDSTRRQQRFVAQPTSMTSSRRLVVKGRKVFLIIISLEFVDI